MEEILASIRRIIEDSDAVRTVEETVIPQAANASSSTARSHTSDIDAFREELREEAPAVVSPVETVELEATDFPAPPVSVPYHELGATETTQPTEPVAAVNAWTPTPSQRQAPAAESETPKQSIISEVASRQVAAAFGELSDAFAATRRRSFDEVAEEMMRPMLQEWLDNNLPTLVEKLVREEIERVARGTAR